MENIVRIASAIANKNHALVNTIIKEILHYDILYALYKSELSKKLIFQGGTALRLCYQSNRYSEDLDFVLPINEQTDIDSSLEAEMTIFKNILTKTIADGYGLEVSYKEPKTEKVGGIINVRRWSANVHINNPNGVNAHHINIEVAAVPSYDNTPVFLAANYDYMPAAYKNIVLRVETLEEIMADKIVAVTGRDYFKARDFWDIKWLTDKNVAVNMVLVKNKIRDYGIVNASDRLQNKADFALTSEAENTFHNEMIRFLDTEMASNLKSFNLSRTILRTVAAECQKIAAALR